MRTIITSYSNPDMDGTAAMFALKELYSQIGKYKEIEYFIFNQFQDEVAIVLNKYKINLNPTESISNNDHFILVDCNELSKTHTAVTPKQIIEIIDHHAVSEMTKNLKDAEINIQSVGAMATLVVEKFISCGIKPSLESSILLYHAIASNTINLKGGVTTDRDVFAFKFLENLYKATLSPKK